MPGLRGDRQRKMERREADGEGGTQESGVRSSRISRDKTSEVLGRRGG